MAEGIISRRGSSSSFSSGMAKTDIITENMTYTVPNHIGNVEIRLIGGGGGGSSRAGGGSGNFNKGSFDIANGTALTITIGCGGFLYWNSVVSTHGGTTSVTGTGVSLSATGGSCANGVNGGAGGAGGGGTQNGGKGWWFGGGGAGDASRPGSGYIGGDGGTYGGGGGVCVSNYTGVTTKHAGNGGTYGGGGGAAFTTWWPNDAMYAIPGNGGTYGGGGAGLNHNYGNYPIWVNKILIGSNGSKAKTNTSTWTNVDYIGGKYLRGWGKTGHWLNSSNANQILAANTYGGTGGFGGNGGNSSFVVLTSWSSSTDFSFRGGGGGGYGGNGGGASNNTSNKGYIGFGGGGGGYGGDGGNSMGGGGGYGPGADGGNHGGGGGGYFAPGGDNGGGGGGFAKGGSGNMSGSGEKGRDGSLGSGGGAGGNSNVAYSYGGNGCAVISYYQAFKDP